MGCGGIIVYSLYNVEDKLWDRLAITCLSQTGRGSISEVVEDVGFLFRIALVVMISVAWKLRNILEKKVSHFFKNSWLVRKRGTAVPRIDKPPT